ncbi:unnamed protein product [Prunus brigantina]
MSEIPQDSSRILRSSGRVLSSFAFGEEDVVRTSKSFSCEDVTKCITLYISNILLHCDYEPCVSYFGTAKLLNPDSSNWTALVGTYISICRTSFGVLALEVIMGKQVPGDFVSPFSFPSTTYANVLLKDVLDQRLPPPLRFHPPPMSTHNYCKAINCLQTSPSTIEANNAHGFSGVIVPNCFFL